MCDVAQVARLLERKWQLLRQVEEATQRMLDCPGEQLEELMWEREKLIKGLQKADAELEESCRDQEDGEQVLAAASGRWEEPPSGRLEEVGQAAQRLRTVLSRLREKKGDLLLTIDLEKIKAATQGGAAKAARFYSQSAGGSTGSRLGRA